MRRVALILLQVQQRAPGLGVHPSRDEGPRFPEQLVALWWRLSIVAVPERTSLFGPPSWHHMGTAETLGCAASAVLSAWESREVLECVVVWCFFFFVVVLNPHSQTSFTYSS